MRIQQTPGHWRGAQRVMETWEVADDERSARVIDREPYGTWAQHLNPVWWLQNDGEPYPPSTYRPTWYRPGSTPEWVRTAAWYLRNPFQNLGKFVLGVADKNYRIIGTAPVLASTMEDAGGEGFKWSVILLGGWLPLPYAGYAGKRWLWYAGWQWWGFVGFKVNRRNVAGLV